ncbi:FAD-dependent oxidoreductase [Patescibacteria group bacterium]|nr:FAD-dependent oxidoreductase [Patescibacteria group bacterium]MCL5798017.1 FAD-dependent oxidoreductase [Patescibacteria group bacterium]
MIKNSKKVVILGAGLAGLAAGYELSKKGINVEIVEKWDDVGGLARTINVNDFQFDTGPHRWYTKSNMVNRWMLKLLGNEVIKVPRLTRIYFDGKFFYYPIKLMNALSGIGIWKAIKAVIDYIYARIRARIFQPKLLTMEDGYINQFGKTLYELFFKRYSEKLWGADCRTISIDWVGQRTRGLNIFTLIRETLFKSKSVVSLVDEFSYPKKGVGRLAQKMAEEIKKKGGRIYLSAEVIGISCEKNSIKSVEVSFKSKKKTRLLADYFISSIPLNELVSRMTPRLDIKYLNLASKLTYRDELQVALFVKKTHITPDTWIYVHPKEIPFMRVMEMDNWSDELSPEGTTTLVFEVACTMGDAVWRKNDKNVIDMVSNSYIKEFKLIKKSDILGGYVHRVPKEYPVYHVNYDDDVLKIKDLLKQFSNLQIIGRNGTFRYNNMDHSIEMGLYAAWNIIAGRKKYDIESVNIEREYLEEKKIENLEDETVETEDE